MNAVNELRDIAVECVRAAGDLIVTRRGTNFNVSRKTIGSDDLVTDVDNEAEELVVDLIRARRPDDSVMAEEGTSIAGTTSVRWIIDPLDGTNNYETDYYPFVSSVAAEIGNEIVCAAVFDPIRNEMFEAIAGGGSRLNGAVLNAHWNKGLDTAKIATAWSKVKTDRPQQMYRAAQLALRVSGIPRSGAAVWDICQVAASRTQGYYYDGLKPWDLHAAGCIAREAGCRVVGLDGNPAVPHEPLVISAPEIADELIALVVSIYEQYPCGVNY